MKRTVGKFFYSLLALVALAVTSGAALADVPHQWQMGMQAPATPIAEQINSLHNLLLYIIIAIALFVLALLVYVCVRYRASANPVPSTTSHNTTIEILWTLIPVLILLIIAVPSFKLLYAQERTPKADLTLKVTGLQWYWHYTYPDQGGFGFDSNGIDRETAKAQGKRALLDVDNEVVLPVGAVVKVLIAGNDVMHSWFIPAFGVQKYAVVGRLNEVWLQPEKEGVYYGECNQICGINHSFMPIKVRVVSKEAFAAWVAEAQKKFARDDGSPAVQQTAAAQ